MDSLITLSILLACILFAIRIIIDGTILLQMLGIIKIYYYDVDKENEENDK